MGSVATSTTAAVARWTPESYVQMIIVGRLVTNEPFPGPAPVGILEDFEQRAARHAVLARPLVEPTLDLEVEEDRDGSAGALALPPERFDERPCRGEIEIAGVCGDEALRVA